MTCRREGDDAEAWSSTQREQEEGRGRGRDEDEPDESGGGSQARARPREETRGRRAGGPTCSTAGPTRSRPNLQTQTYAHSSSVHVPFRVQDVLSRTRSHSSLVCVLANSMSYSRIKIAARLRPALPAEQHDNAIRVVRTQSGPAIHVDNPRDATQTFKYPCAIPPPFFYLVSPLFSFSSCYDESSTQQEIFGRDVEPLIQLAFSGIVCHSYSDILYSVSIFYRPSLSSPMG